MHITRIAFAAGVAQALATATDHSTSPDVRTCVGQLNGQLPAERPSSFNFSGNTRTYYLSAEEVVWDYAPDGWDNWLGVPIQDSPRASQAGYLKSSGSLGGDTGLKWHKALFRGYTDKTFRTQTKEQPGIQGPTMRAEVGDMIQVLLVNRLPKHYASLHAMGLTYGKSNEGSLYPPSPVNGTTPPAETQQAVPPGGCTVIKWLVAGPNAPPPGQLSTLWGYHSYVDLQSDANAGLIGPVIVYQPGTMESTVKSTREISILYNQFNEATSFMAETNYAAYGNGSQKAMPVTLVNPHTGNESYWKPQLTNMATLSLSAKQAPNFNALNGYVFSSGPAYEMCEGEQIIWYVYAYGQASHVFHLHGDNFKVGGNYMASNSINNGVMMSFSSGTALPGLWQAICHVQNHLSQGMVANYRVYPKGSCPLRPLSSAPAYLEHRG